MVGKCGLVVAINKSLRIVNPTCDLGKRELLFQHYWHYFGVFIKDVKYPKWVLQKKYPSLLSSPCQPKSLPVYFLCYLQLNLHVLHTFVFLQLLSILIYKVIELQFVHFCHLECYSGGEMRKRLCKLRLNRNGSLWDILVRLYRILHLNNQQAYLQSQTVMKSTEQHLNYDQTLSNRNPSQHIANKQNTKPASSQPPFHKERGTDAKMQDTHKLYIRQFFEHFFEKKSMLEVLSQISNGIQVIQTLIVAFQNSRGIRSNTKLTVKSRIDLNGDFPNVVERQGRQISECLEGLYHRLQSIFDQSPNQSKQCDQIPKLFNSQGGDEQLYDMLNTLKEKYGKQKSIREQAESKWRELQRTIIRLQDQKKRISQSYKNRDAQVSLLNKKIDQLEQRIQSLTQEVSQSERQKEQLNQKLTVLFQINQNLSQVQKDNVQLNAKLKKCQQNQIRLSNKFDALQVIVKKKIQQKEDKWKSMVEQKLNSKSLFSNASCSAFRQFMSSIHTANK